MLSCVFLLKYGGSVINTFEGVNIIPFFLNGRDNYGSLLIMTIIQQSCDISDDDDTLNIRKNCTPISKSILNTNVVKFENLKVSSDNTSLLMCLIWVG